MKTLALIFAILSVFSSIGQNIKNDLTEINLKGRVSSMSESNYSAIEKFGEAQKVSIESKSIRKFDNNGKLTEYNLYSSDGRLIAEIVCKFDGKGKMTEENCSGTMDEKSTYKYDDNGYMTEINSYSSEGSLKSKSTFKYDKNGNKIAVNYCRFDSDDKLLDNIKWIFNYDKDWFLTEENGYNPDGSLDCKISYLNDEKGNLTEQVNSNYKSGSLKDKQTYKYNDHGNKIEQNDFTSDGSLETKFTYKYDDKGFMTEEIFSSYKIGSSDLNTKYRYDKYDKTGNWIKREKYINDFLINITERKIEFYL